MFFCFGKVEEESPKAGARNPRPASAEHLGLVGNKEKYSGDSVPLFPRNLQEVFRSLGGVVFSFRFVVLFSSVQG